MIRHMNSLFQALKCKKLHCFLWWGLAFLSTVTIGHSGRTWLIFWVFSFLCGCLFELNFLVGVLVVLRFYFCRVLWVLLLLGISCQLFDRKLIQLISLVVLEYIRFSTVNCHFWGFTRNLVQLVQLVLLVVLKYMALTL